MHILIEQSFICIWLSIVYLNTLAFGLFESILNKVIIWLALSMVGSTHLYVYVQAQTQTQILLLKKNYYLV